MVQVISLIKLQAKSYLHRWLLSTVLTVISNLKQTQMFVAMN